MKIKVVYTTDKLNEMLDNHIRHMFETNNFHWYAQGYSVEKKERDMCFDVPNCFADKTKETVNSAAFVENGKAIIQWIEKWGAKEGLSTESRVELMSIPTKALPQNAELHVERVHEMAVESLSPDKYEQLIDSLTWLCRTRKINNSLPQAGKQQGQPAIPLSIVREVLEDKYDPMAELDIDELIDDMEEIAKQQA